MLASLKLSWLIADHAAVDRINFLPAQRLAPPEAGCAGLEASVDPRLGARL